MYDSRLNLCRQVAEDAKEYFGAKVFRTPDAPNVRLAEAPSFGKPILLYDVQSVGAKSYLAVAQELLQRRRWHHRPTRRRGADGAATMPGTSSDWRTADAPSQRAGARCRSGTRAGAAARGDDHE